MGLMVAHIKFNIIDEINHIALQYAFATLCGESLTSGNTGKWVELKVHAPRCEKCIKACNALIGALQACLPQAELATEYLGG